MDFANLVSEILLKIQNVIVEYRDRPAGSESKLNTVSDGVKVMKTIFTLYKNYKPLAFFSIVAAILLALGLIFFIPIFMQYLETGLVRIPTLVISILFFICSVQSIFSGLILDNIINTSKQNFEMRLIDCEHELKKEN